MKCEVCGRRLSSNLSVESGHGPDCARHVLTTTRKRTTSRPLSEWDRYKSDCYKDLWKMDLRCLCGDPADALHFVDKEPGHYPRSGEDVVIVYSCKSHDWDGYMITFDRLFECNWDRHLDGKNWARHMAIDTLIQWAAIPHHHGLLIPGAPKW